MTYQKIKEHYGHHIEIAIYGDADNVAIECMDCHCVIVDADREKDPG